MHLKRAGVAALGILVGGISLVACSSNSPVTAGSTSTTSATKAPGSPTTSTSVAATSTSVASSSTTTSTATVAAGEPCKHASLVLTAGPTQGAAGTIYFGFAISDAGPVACTLQGYPGVTLAGASGPVSPQVSHSGQGAIFTDPAAKVTLNPGVSPQAGFVLSYSDVPQQNGQTTCPAVSAVTFALPGAAGSFTVQKSFTPCGKPNVSVSAIVSESRYKAQFAR